MKTILKIIKDIFDFLLCLLSVNCNYSIKKFFSFVFVALIIYLTIFTTESIELINSFLLFLGGLLAIRSYDKTVATRNQKPPDEI